MSGKNFVFISSKGNLFRNVQIFLLYHKNKLSQVYSYHIGLGISFFLVESL